jgi:hypothetical protein
LTGNGVAGVDLDNCVVDGVPKPEAIQLLSKLNAAYIEYSPSGNGLRAFGYAKLPLTGVNGQFGGLCIELYTTARYLTITGHSIKNEPLRDLIGFEYLAKKVRRKLTEDTDSNSSVSSVSSVSTAMDFPISAIPYTVGQRHRALFELARWVKGREPNATRERMLKIVRYWHAKYLHIIGTKEFEVSWLDFQYAFSRVEKPFGTTLESILRNLPSPPDTPELHIYGAKAIHLMRICMALQAYYGTEPLYLSCRTAGELIDYNHTDTAKLLQIFIFEGWLTLVKAGAGSKASRYRLNIRPK